MPGEHGAPDVKQPQKFTTKDTKGTKAAEEFLMLDGVKGSGSGGGFHHEGHEGHEGSLKL